MRLTWEETLGTGLTPVLSVDDHRRGLRADDVVEVHRAVAVSELPLAPEIVLLDADLSGVDSLVRVIMTDAPTAVVVPAARDHRSPDHALTSLAEGALSVQLRLTESDGPARPDCFRTVIIALADVGWYGGAGPDLPC